MDTFYTCKHCYKEYKRKTNFDRHILICELIKKDNSTKNFDEEDEIPSNRKLYNIILELANKNNELEKKVRHLTSKLERWTEIKKKKMNIIEWLNTNCMPEFTFKELCDTFLENVNRSHLEKIFEHGHIKGFSRILYSLFKDADIIYPIKAFEQNNNCLYVYNYTIEINDMTKEWIILSNELFNKFISDLCKLIMREFIAWKDENKHRIENDDFAVEYNTKLLQVLGGNLTTQETNHKLKNNLYKHLKTNLKNIIEFDFVF